MSNDKEITKLLHDDFKLKHGNYNKESRRKFKFIHQDIDGFLGFDPKSTSDIVKQEEVNEILEELEQIQNLELTEDEELETESAISEITKIKEKLNDPSNINKGEITNEDLKNINKVENSSKMGKINKNHPIEIEIGIEGNQIEIEIGIEGNQIEIEGNQIGIEGNQIEIKSRDRRVQIEIEGNQIEIEGNQIEIEGNHIEIEGIR